MGITAVVIFSLLGTSVLAYFLVQREVGQPQSALQAAQDGSGAPAEMLLRDSTAPLADSAAPPLPTTAATQPVLGPAATEATTINRLVLINDRGQVETMAPDGSDPRQLTALSDGTFYQFPAWSPDGTAVAAIGTTSNGGGIYVFDDLLGSTDADEASRYFSETQRPIYLYWSPDSANVAFLANHSRDTLALSIVPGSGGDSRVVATGSPLYWNWAQDSEILLLHSGDTGAEARLVAIDADGAEQTPNLAQPGQFQAPGISPGGRYWTYAEEEGRGVSTLIVAHTGTGERRLVEQAGSVAMTWSPTAEQLAYTSGGVDAHPFWGPLRLVNAETGDTRLLTTETVLAFFWSPDGRQLAYLTVNGRPREDVYASAERTQRVSRMAATQPVQQGGSGFLSLSVMDVSTGQGLRLFNFQPTPIFVTQFMPFFGQYALSHQVWSPDSTEIVLPVRDDAGDVIMIIPVDGGAPRVVAEGDIAFWSHR